MTIGEIGILVTAVITGGGGLWAAYWAVRKQVYAQVQGETRMEQVNQTVTQLESETSRQDAVITDLQERLDWYELEEVPRLKDRIDELGETAEALSAVHRTLESLVPMVEGLWTRWGRP